MKINKIFLLIFLVLITHNIHSNAGGNMGMNNGKINDDTELPDPNKYNEDMFNKKDSQPMNEGSKEKENKKNNFDKMEDPNKKNESEKKNHGKMEDPDEKDKVEKNNHDKMEDTNEPNKKKENNHGNMDDPNEENKKEKSDKPENKNGNIESNKNAVNRNKPKGKCPKTEVVDRSECDKDGNRWITMKKYEGNDCLSKNHKRQVKCAKDPNVCRCSAVGDPHYKTFDKQVIHFYGACQYTLSQYKRPGYPCNYHVYVDNEYRGNSDRVSYTRNVHIEINDVKFSLLKNKKLEVNGDKTKIPYTKKFDNGDDIRVFRSGKMLQFVNKYENCKMKLAFDGISNAFVEIPKTLNSDFLSGICGNCNGEKDDYKTKGGTDVTDKDDRYTLIGNSYQIENKEKPCPPAEEIDLTKICSAQFLEKIKGEEYCGALLKGSPFDGCISVMEKRIDIEEYYEDCLIDLCSAEKDTPETIEKLRCELFAGLNEECTERGYEGIQWRTDLKCPMQCGKNQIFSNKAPPCPKTCETHFFGTSAPCYDLPEREDCVCEDGYILDGALCVKPKDCKCIDLCVDKESKCGEWKKEGRCETNKYEMSKICEKTCGICTPKSKKCENELETLKCLEFKDQGLCNDTYYKSICGLTCNLEDCACGPDQIHESDCNEITKQKIITYITEFRNYDGECVKSRTQVKEVCDCPFKKNDERTPCNYCNGTYVLMTHIQEVVDGECVHRTVNETYQCEKCDKRLKVTSKCVNNGVNITTTTYYASNDCYDCHKVVDEDPTNIICNPTKRLPDGPCDAQCVQKFTTVSQEMINCKCYDVVSYDYEACCCNKNNTVSKSCVDGTWVLTYTNYTFESKKCESKISMDEAPVENCVAEPNKVGDCVECPNGKDGECYATDVVNYATVNPTTCECEKTKTTNRRICKCPNDINVDVCKNNNIKDIETRSYVLEEYKPGKFKCKLNSSSSQERIEDSDTKDQTGDCDKVKTCTRPDYQYYYKVEDCKLVKIVFPANYVKCCCFPLAPSKECIGNRYLKVTTYNNIFNKKGCMDCTKEVNTTEQTEVTCKKPVIKRSGCDEGRLIKTTTKYEVVNCTCKEVIVDEFENCTCEPKEYKRSTVSDCNKDTCYVTIAIEYRNNECVNVTRYIYELCVCLPKQVTKYCDKSTGAYIITTTIQTFMNETKTCKTDSFSTTYPTICANPIIDKEKECGKTREGFIKVVKNYQVLNTVDCECLNKTETIFEICECPKPYELDPMCANNEVVITRYTYKLNKELNLCTKEPKTRKETVICPKNPQTLTSKISKCETQVKEFVYQLQNCECILNNITYVLYSCSPDDKIKTVCYNDVEKYTYITSYIISDDKRSIKETVTTKINYIDCKIKVKYGPYSACDSTTQYKTREMTYFKPSNCSCVEDKVVIEKMRCDCPDIKGPFKECQDNKTEVITRTIYTLQGNSCVPHDDYQYKQIECDNLKSTIDYGVCTLDPKTKSGTKVKTTKYWVTRNCTCVELMKNETIDCNCTGCDPERSECINGQRWVTPRKQRYDYRTNTCVWKKYEENKFQENCDCQASTTNTVCVNNVIKRTTTTRYLKQWKDPIRMEFECTSLQEHDDTDISKTCTQSSTQTNPCENNVKLTYENYYEVNNCECIPRKKVTKKEACDCELKNDCEKKCINGQKLINRCNKYEPYYDICKVSITEQPIDIPCATLPDKQTGLCEIVKNNGKYRSITIYYHVIEDCKCVLKSKTFDELCHCNEPKSPTKDCVGKQYKISTINYVFDQETNGCNEKINTQFVKIHCQASTLRYEDDGCKRKYVLTKYTLENCECKKKEITRFNDLCCDKPRESLKCEDHKYVYTRTVHELYISEERLFSGFDESPFSMLCVNITKTRDESVECDVGDYTEKIDCDPVTNVFTVKKLIVKIENCECKKDEKVTTEKCTPCPKSKEVVGPCNVIGEDKHFYERVTVESYEMLEDKTCKKTEKNFKRICKCRDSQRITKCIDGEYITSVISYTFCTYPKCAPFDYIEHKEKIFCYNYGKENPWNYVKTIKCYEPLSYTYDYYERYVYKDCNCTLETKKEIAGICCKDSEDIVCENDKIKTIRIQRIDVNNKCQDFNSSTTEPVICPDPSYKPVKECDENGFETVEEVKYIIKNCKCDKKVNTTKRLCKCVPSDTKEEKCLSDDKKVSIYTEYKLENYECVPYISKITNDVNCGNAEKYRDDEIDDCTFLRTFYTYEPKNCECVEKVINETTLNSKCCEEPKVNTVCVNETVWVTTKTTQNLLNDYTCKWVNSVDTNPVDCTYVKDHEVTQISMCEEEHVKFEVYIENCECKRRRSSSYIVEICCTHKIPKNNQYCDQAACALTTEKINWVLEGKKCVEYSSNSTESINCEQRPCTTKTLDCVDNTRKVETYCQKCSDKCTCTSYLKEEYNECCDHKPNEDKKDCDGEYITITYYVYKIKENGKCEKVVGKIDKIRCECPKEIKNDTCPDGLNILVTEITNFTLNKVNNDCDKSTEIKKIPIRDPKTGIICPTVKTKVGEPIEDICDKKTGRGKKTYKTLEAKDCKCIEDTIVEPYICYCFEARSEEKCINKTRYLYQYTYSCSYTNMTENVNINILPDVICKTDGYIFKRSICRTVDIFEYTKTARTVSVYEEYIDHNCNCQRKVVANYSEICDCFDEDTKSNCENNDEWVVKTTKYYTDDKKTECFKNETKSKQKIKCDEPTTETKKGDCKNNKYLITYVNKFVKDCECKTSETYENCDCKCKNNSDNTVCDGNFNIVTTKISYEMENCRCKESVQTTSKLPECPKVPDKIETECNKTGNSGYKNITTYELELNNLNCSCELKENTISELCWCKPERKNETVECKSNLNAFLMRTLEQKLVDGKCKFVEVYSWYEYVKCQDDIKDKSECDNKTGDQSETTTSFYVDNCLCKEKKSSITYKCFCPPGWKVIDEDDCPGKPKCEYKKIMQQLTLVNKECVKINRTDIIKCCCDPSIKKTSECISGDTVFNKTLKWTIINNECVSSCNSNSKKVSCDDKKWTKNSDCVKGKDFDYRYITTDHYKYEVDNCECKETKYKTTTCRCDCPKGDVKRTCEQMESRIKINTISYKLNDCSCEESNNVTYENIKCPEPKITRSECTRQKPDDLFSSRIITTVSYKINETCMCDPTTTSVTEICECFPNYRISGPFCDPILGVKTTDTTMQVKVGNACVDQKQSDKEPVICGNDEWVFAYKSSCIDNVVNNTYERHMRKACECVKETKVETCNCDCNGIANEIKCIANVKYQFNYKYEFSKCKCIKSDFKTEIPPNCPPNTKFDYSDCILNGDGALVKKESKIEYFYIDCECTPKVVHVKDIICECPKGNSSTVCNTLNNKITYKKTWYELNNNYCKENNEEKTEDVPCDFTPVYKEKIKCDTKTNKQVFEKLFKQLTNCNCTDKVDVVILPCDCKEPKVERDCDKKTCKRTIKTTYYRNTVLKDGTIECIPSTHEDSEPCCCLKKNSTISICKDNELNITTTNTYYFDEDKKICVESKNDCTETVKCPEDQIDKIDNNPATCDRTITKIQYKLVNCICSSDKVVNVEKYCCVKDADVNITCIDNVLWNYTTKYIFRKLEKVCESEKIQNIIDVYVPPDSFDKYCDPVTGVETITNIKNFVKNCKPDSTTNITKKYCHCNAFKSYSNKTCDRTTGITKEMTTTYRLSDDSLSCLANTETTFIPARCKAGNKTEKGECNVDVNYGIYREITTHETYYDSDCDCHSRKLINYELCKCYDSKVEPGCTADGLYKYENLIEYIQVKSDNYNYNYACNKTIKEINKKEVTCNKPIIENVTSCISNSETYLKTYYEILNCNCIKLEKRQEVPCGCDKGYTTDECLSKTLKFINITSYELVCKDLIDKTQFPECKCIEQVSNRTEHVPIPSDKIICINKTNEIQDITYKALTCKNYTEIVIKYEWPCDECREYPKIDCKIVKMNGQCALELYRKHLCPISCGECEECEKPKVIRKTSPCNCEKYEVFKVCRMNYTIKYPVRVGKKCEYKFKDIESICECVDKKPKEYCSAVKDRDECDNPNNYKDCIYTCSPQCQACSGEISNRTCVHSGEHKGTYEVLTKKYEKMYDVCIGLSEIKYEGDCKACNTEKITYIVSNCDINNKRTVSKTIYYVSTDNECLENTTVTTYECCCPDYETIIGDCDANMDRVIVKKVWLKVQDCCKQFTFKEIHKCDPKCIKVETQKSKCLYNNMMIVKTWYNAGTCTPNSVSNMGSCLPDAA